MSRFGTPSNKEGLIHPSTTSQPPKFTALTLEELLSATTKKHEHSTMADEASRQPMHSESGSEFPEGPTTQMITC